jgi:erythronate-4-phosphate dehydrogenase
MKKPYIVCDEQVPYARETFSRIGRICLLSADEIKSGNIRSADVLIVRSVTKVNSSLLSGCAVKTVGSVTSGIDHVDTAMLRRLGIKLISAPGSNANSVAEYVIASLSAWSLKRGITLKGKKIGIVGVGQVGSRVDKKCRALGMKTIWYDPPLARRTGDPRYRPMRDIRSSDIITFHVPLTLKGRDATYHMAGDELFRSVKKPFLLINTARGKVMDEKAVLKYARQEMIRGLILDVWPDEPDVNPALLKMADIATPHIAGYSLDGRVRAVEMVFRALCRHYKIRDDRPVMDLLPAAAKALSKIPLSTANSEEKLKCAILSAYDPRIDDRKFRKICDLIPEKRRAYFERLRKDYPIRREYGCYRADLPGTGPGFRNNMKKLGFRC